MAETKLQPQSEQRSVSRREDYYPSRDLFSFSPFSMMRRMTEEMDRAFDRALTGNLSGWRSSGGESMWAPVVDVRERNNMIEVSAELPGLTKDDVKVECTEDGISIQGERKREQESHEGGIHRTERSYGRFYRHIPLPEGCETDKAKAEFKNGMLQVQVPFSAQKQQKTKQIPISG